MGVKYLISFLRRFAPDSIKKVDEKELRYKTLAIDGTLLIRRMFSSPWVPALDKYRHILWTLYLARICRFYKVIPIVVFDGQRSAPEKSDERIRRTNIKEDNRKNFVENINQAARLKNLIGIAYQMSKLNMQDREVIDLFLKKAIYVYNNFECEISGSNSYQSDLGIKLQIWMKNEFSIYKNGNCILESLLKQIIDYICKISLNSTVELASELSTLVNLLDPHISYMVRDNLERQQMSMNMLIEKLSRRLSAPTWKQINQTKTIFKILGMTVLTSPPGYEAEAVASSLVNNGIADFVVTEDTDTLLFNAKMLRGFMSMKNLINGRNNFFPSSNMYMIDPIDVRLNLGNISIDSFIDFAILSGTDFCKTIKGLGCHGAFFLIQKYKNIESILENLSKFKTKDGRQKYVAPENYIQEVQIARKVFMRVSHMHFFDHKLIISDNSLFNIKEKDWKELENSIIDKYKLKQLNLSFFSTF
ncbi:hypothetical protein T552_04074 [Pneumocystis carinii B80]|uniref:XPG N-terminal domain-containing protein n=1 Tax=Pneumocystis carinii (strain B80) TaxID=1408658 RepID=A0A0W4ZP62_PNEC8|nr:hypothetical protein T552_04074 [Pneumocystis carinii B80]KTW30165.1 hypothetical protein T552_04074 [Pneumocystis carinii B80]